MQKLALSLITVSKKIRPYFQAQSILVLTNFPLQQVLEKPNVSGRLLKWVVQLSKFDIVPKIEEVIKPVKPSIWNLLIYIFSRRQA